jgi:hypothetical protein
MKIKIALFALTTGLLSCNNQKTETPQKKEVFSVVGSWQLLSGTLIEKGDTVVTDYTKNISFIKIINESHFAFLQHDLNKGQDSAASFSAGGGYYTLKDSLYTEHLEYCTARNWEGHDFSFTMTIKGDTLIQSGVEVIESEGVNRKNTEKYIRIKK